MASMQSWFLAILVGLMLTLGGLFWDALIHSQEAGHIAEESLLSLSNPGHVVFGLGLALTALMVLAGFTVGWLRERRPALGWQSLGVPAVLWLMVGMAGAVTLAALAQTG